MTYTVPLEVAPGPTPGVFVAFGAMNAPLGVQAESNVPLLALSAYIRVELVAAIINEPSGVSTGSVKNCGTARGLVAQSPSAEPLGRMA